MMNIRWLPVSLLATAVVTMTVTPSVSYGDKKKPSTEKAMLGSGAARSLDLNEQGTGAIKGRDFARAETLFKQALEADPKNVTAAFNLAGMYITNKKEQEAITLLETYSAQVPGDPGLHARLADAYFGTQDIEKAAVRYENALKLDPHYPGAAARLGTISAMRGDLNRALQLFTSAVKDNPRDAESLTNLAGIALALGKQQDAIANAKKAIQLRPTATAFVTLGTAYQQSKDPKNALTAFQRAKELGSADPELPAVIASLEAEIAKGS